MKVVLDTNVLVSGLLTRTGTCSIILNLVFDGRIISCLDDRILEEYCRVCRDPRLDLDQTMTHTVLELLNNISEHSTPMPWKGKLPDEDDIPFLEIAMEAEAILITGNKKHFPARACGHACILSPAEFVTFYSEQQKQS